MVNYYEILEVSENASKEVIEKAYKALVKKYHPDLQPDSGKIEAEKKIKIVNEAYEILSDESKKQKYDNKLNEYRTKQYSQFSDTKVNTNTNTNINYNSNFTSNKVQDNTSKIKEYYNDYYKKAYNDAYIKTLKNMGYTIKYKKTFKQHLLSLIAIVSAFAFLILLFVILWHIPFTKKIFLNLYSDNYIIKLIIDSILNIIK